MANATTAARTTEMRNCKGPQAWVARIEAALVPGTFLITPHGEVFCPKCAGGLEFTDYQTVTVTGDDIYYCENC